jgi:hypothetical protein
MERVRKLQKFETYVMAKIWMALVLPFVAPPPRQLSCYANADHTGLCSIEIRRHEMACCPHHISWECIACWHLSLSPEKRIACRAWTYCGTHSFFIFSDAWKPVTDVIRDVFHFCGLRVKINVTLRMQTHSIQYEEILKHREAYDVFLRVSTASSSHRTPRFCGEDSEGSYEHLKWRRENSAVEIEVTVCYFHVCTSILDSLIYLYADIDR